MFSSQKLEDKRKEVALALVSSKYDPIIQRKLEDIKGYEEEIFSLSNQLDTVVTLGSSDNVLKDENLRSLATMEKSQIEENISYAKDMISTSRDSIDYLTKIKESEQRLVLLELEKSHDESNLIPKRMKEATDSNFTKEDMKYLLIIFIQILILAAFIYIIVKIIK